jgi:hypothetical protein
MQAPVQVKVVVPHAYNEIEPIVQRRHLFCNIWASCCEIRLRMDMGHLSVPNLRTTLRRIKDDPYPSVTLFHNNLPRYYRKDDASGQWVRFHYKHEEPPPSLAPVLASTLPPPPTATVPQAVMPSWPHIPPTQTYY